LDKSLNKYWRLLITHKQIKLLQYVGDLFISQDKKKEVTEATIALLNFLGQQRLRMSKSKTHFVGKEVKYLGHVISEGKWRLSLQQISGIISMPLPNIHRELRKFLGLIGY
jgi:hypothetical protein